MVRKIALRVRVPLLSLAREAESLVVLDEVDAPLDGRNVPWRPVTYC